MIEHIVNAAKHAFLKNQVPWLLSAITDWSYEEGSAPSFAAYTRLYEAAGAPTAITGRMRLGINGFLNEELGATGLCVTSRNKGPGCDFALCTTDRVKTAHIESKLSYDCTFAKYYREIGRDRDKLLGSPVGQSFQVVYLVSLPNYRYPRGVWNGSSYAARQSNNLGLAAQWRAIQAELPYPTAFSNGQPLELTFQLDAIEQAMPYLVAYFEHVFRPSTPWIFDRQRHLSEAAVGIALWQWR